MFHQKAKNLAAISTSCPAALAVPKTASPYLLHLSLSEGAIKTPIVTRGRVNPERILAKLARNIYDPAPPLAVAIGKAGKNPVLLPQSKALQPPDEPLAPPGRLVASSETSFQVVRSRRRRKYTPSEHCRRVLQRCNREWTARVDEARRKRLAYADLDKIPYAVATEYHGILPPRGTIGLDNYQQLRMQPPT